MIADKPRRARKGQSDNKLKEDDLNTNRLPAYVARIVIYEYVTSMQKSHSDRMKRWEGKMASVTEEVELQNFLGTTEGDAHAQKSHRAVRFGLPRKIYINEDEIMNLVNQKMEVWHKGGYIHVKMNYLRILRRAFRALRGEYMKARRPTVHEEIVYKRTAKPPAKARADKREEARVEEQESQAVVASSPEPVEEVDEAAAEEDTFLTEEPAVS